MKIRLYDSMGREILPITTKKARKLVKEGEVLALSKTPPKLKLKKNSFGVGISRKIYLLNKRYGSGTVKGALITGVLALMVICGAIGLIINHHNSIDAPEDLISPTKPQATKKMVMETTTTTVTQNTSESTRQPTTLNTEKTTVYTPAEKNSNSFQRGQTTTHRESEETTTVRIVRRNNNSTTVKNNPTTVKENPVRETKGNGLHTPDPANDDIPTLDPREQEELPIL